MKLKLTHIGTATVLLEVMGMRILTDPALDPAGRTYGFGFGTHSTKLLGPQLPPGGLGRIDAVLISHDQHADNLDDAGRALLPSAGAVVTTEGGPLCHAAVIARELGIPAVVGAAGALREIPDGAEVEVDPVAGTVRIISAAVAV